jgi:hypothetical protein
VVPGAGIEPALPFGNRILSPKRLPFRHPGKVQLVETWDIFSAHTSRMSALSAFGIQSEKMAKKWPRSAFYILHRLQEDNESNWKRTTCNYNSRETTTEA